MNSVFHPTVGPYARALLVTRNLPPLTGGMERLNWHLASELAQEFAVSICGPEGCPAQLPKGTTVEGTFPSSPLPRFLLKSFLGTLDAARRVMPHLLIAGSGVTAPHICIAARQVGARTLVYLHGLDLVTTNPVYRALFLPFIRRCNVAVVNSTNTARLARAQGIESGKIHILHPGVAPPFDLRCINAVGFRTRFGIGQGPLLLSVGRLTSRKGLKEFVRYCLPELVNNHRGLLLLVVGGAADEQLSARSKPIQEEVMREAAILGLSNHLMFTGKVDDTTLAQAWRASNVHIFPVLDLPGDVEGFGMVALEAAAHGLPTIGFATGGVPDAIADGRSGILIPSGDYKGMTKAINNLLNGGYPGISPENCIAFAQPMSWPAFGDQLRAICHSTLEGRQ